MKGKWNIPGCHDRERESFNKLLDAGFLDVFRELYPDKIQYSWWSFFERLGLRKDNDGFRLDYFLISDFMRPMVIDTIIWD
jgi:exodeoxyribonuclease III